MKTKLYRVDICMTVFVSADSEEEAKRYPSLVVQDDEETFGRPAPAEVRTAVRVKSLGEVPETMHDVVPYGAGDAEDCPCEWENDESELTDYGGRGLHTTDCGYFLSCKELIQRQDAERGVDPATVPLFPELLP